MKKACPRERKEDFQNLMTEVVRVDAKMQRLSMILILCETRTKIESVLILTYKNESVFGKTLPKLFLMNLQIHIPEDHQKTEGVGNILSDSFGFYIQNFLRIKLVGVFRLRVFAEVHSSSALFCRAEVEALSQNVASNDFHCFKDSAFLATD